MMRDHFRGLQSQLYPLGEAQGLFKFSRLFALARLPRAAKIRRVKSLVEIALAEIVYVTASYPVLKFEAFGRRGNLNNIMLEQVQVHSS